MADDIQKSDKQTISFVTMRRVIPMSLIIVTPVGVASLGEYTKVAISWLVFLFDRFPYWQSATLHLMCFLTLDSRRPKSAKISIISIIRIFLQVYQVSHLSGIAVGGTTGLLAGGAANSSVGLAGMLLQGDRLWWFNQIEWIENCLFSFVKWSPLL